MEDNRIIVFTYGWLFYKEALERNKQNDEGTNTTGWINNCFSPWKEFCNIKNIIKFLFRHY